MTVTYSLDVSTVRFSGLARLLSRWRGSIYSLVYREFIVFLGFYYILVIIYRAILDEGQQRSFESLVRYFRKFTDSLPMTFILSFYVSLVIGRWWNQYMNIPGPDKACLAVGSLIRGADESTRLLRRTLGRYLNIVSVLTFQAVSMPVKKRFPTLDAIVKSGIMTQAEKEFLEATKSPYGTFFQPLSWFTTLCVRARDEGKIKSDAELRQIYIELFNFRDCCANLFSYDWISVPLVYTQAVTIAVYTFFITCIFGRQYLFTDTGDAQEGSLAKYFPLLTCFQFFFYCGWFKTAEQLLNPLGEDADDFELNFVIDRNLQVTFLLIDTLHARTPPVEKDNFWDESADIQRSPSSTMPFFLGSVSNVDPTQEGWFDPMNRKLTQFLSPASSLRKASDWFMGRKSSELVRNTSEIPVSNRRSISSAAVINRKSNLETIAETDASPINSMANSFANLNDVPNVGVTFASISEERRGRFDGTSRGPYLAPNQDLETIRTNAGTEGFSNPAFNKSD